MPSLNEAVSDNECDSYRNTVVILRLMENGQNRKEEIVDYFLRADKDHNKILCSTHTHMLTIRTEFDLNYREMCTAVPVL